jgi:hypothetical protein
VLSIDHCFFRGPDDVPEGTDIVEMVKEWKDYWGLRSTSPPGFFLVTEQTAMPFILAMNPHLFKDIMSVSTAHVSTMERFFILYSEVMKAEEKCELGGNKGCQNHKNECERGRAVFEEQCRKFTHVQKDEIDRLENMFKRCDVVVVPSFLFLERLKYAEW